MSPVEPAGTGDVGETVEREVGKSGGLGQRIGELPAEFVLELLERSLVEARAKGGGQLRERHDRVVGSEHATEVELEEVGEGDSVAVGDDAGDLVVVTLDVAVGLPRDVERSRELAGILARGLARRAYGFCVSRSALAHAGDCFSLSLARSAEQPQQRQRSLWLVRRDTRTRAGDGARSRSARPCDPLAGSYCDGPGRDRTCDLGIKSPLLYQLSYRPRGLGKGTSGSCSGSS